MVTGKGGQEEAYKKGQQKISQKNFFFYMHYVIKRKFMKGYGIKKDH